MLFSGKSSLISLMRRINFFSLAFLFFLLALLPLLLASVKKVRTYLSRARGVPANIIVDTSQVLGPLPHNWQFLAQGGEEAGRMLFPVISEISELSPKYIRIDHIFDFYDVVQKEDGQLIFNWERLDQTVNDILTTGALPFFSLSYMPPAISQDGNVTSLPAN